MPVVYCKTTPDLLISFDPKAVTHRLAAGRQHASRLLKRFVQVVWKPFILILFRTQLHKLACNERQVSQWQRWWWLLLYSAVLHSQTDSLCLHVTLYEWLAFYSVFLNIHWSGVLTALAWLVPRETAAISAQVLWTPYNHAARHFVQSHICTVYVCLAVTCHLHFWQDDWDLVCATAVTRGWSSYQSMCQHRKLTLEKKILPPLLQGFKPATFQSRVQLSKSNHWAILLPMMIFLQPSKLSCLSECQSTWGHQLTKPEYVCSGLSTATSGCFSKWPSICWQCYSCFKV